jgi:hypothetical protein
MEREGWTELNILKATTAPPKSEPLQELLWTVQKGQPHQESQKTQKNALKIRKNPVS